jgi:hypothetical protein
MAQIINETIHLNKDETEQFIENMTHPSTDIFTKRNNFIRLKTNDKLTIKNGEITLETDTLNDTQTSNRSSQD